MAKFCDLVEPAWRTWLAECPPIVRELAERFPPNRLYRLHDTGQRVTILSYAEEGTLRVYVSGQWNLIMYEREVFGVHPENLEECDLPNQAESHGVVLTRQEDVDRWITKQLKNVGAR